MKRKEIQIALMAIIGMVVLYFGLQFLKGLSLFSTDRNYYVKFKDISGLSASSPIYANGFKVGVVENIIYDYTITSPEVGTATVTDADGNTAAVKRGDLRAFGVSATSTEPVYSGNVKQELVYSSNHALVDVPAGNKGVGVTKKNFFTNKKK